MLRIILLWYLGIGLIFAAVLIGLTQLLLIIPDSVLSRLGVKDAVETKNALDQKLRNATHSKMLKVVGRMIFLWPSVMFNKDE